MQARDDGDLIRACEAGDESAWKELILRYRRLIYSIPVAYRMASSEADEIFQSVSLKLFQHLGNLRKKDSLAPWLAVTTRRECQAALRAGRRWTPIDEQENDEALQEDPPDVAQALHDVSCEHMLVLAFERMDEACRTLLGALYLEEPPASYQEISARTGRPIGSLGPTRARCLQKLREIYTGLGGEKP